VDNGNIYVSSLWGHHVQVVCPPLIVFREAHRFLLNLNITPLEAAPLYFSTFYFVLSVIKIWQSCKLLKWEPH